jgi:hypothetical protein
MSKKLSAQKLDEMNEEATADSGQRFATPAYPSERDHLG